MTVDKTIIEWPYEPPNFFETPIHRSYPEYDLDIQDSRARAALKTPVDSVSEDLKTSIQKRLEAVFTGRQLYAHLTHTSLDLERIRIYQHHSDGNTSAAITVKGTMVAMRAEPLNITLTDTSGRVVRDFKAERIAEQDKYIDLIVDAVEKHPLVQVLFKSYCAAVDDPDNEFIHLFEICDALKKHFNGEQNTKKLLGISDIRWKRLGKLANNEPVEQGRHRGQHPYRRRPASQKELEEARAIAKELIHAFIRTL